MLTLNNISINNFYISCNLFSSSLFIFNNLPKVNYILRLIAGLEKDQRSKIFWNDQKIVDIYYLYSSDINYIPQKNNLDQELTIKQNFDFLSSLSETQSLADSAILYFGLENLINHKIKNLNDEEMQKVKLSQLIFSPKTMWILEKPDQFLSQKWQEKLFNLISVRIKEGGLVIISSDNKIFNKIGQNINLNDLINSKNI
jgi:ABC-type transport system involved in cytochrome c biogenesis ATPase subunit